MGTQVYNSLSKTTASAAPNVGGRVNTPAMSAIWTPAGISAKHPQPALCSVDMLVRLVLSVSTTSEKICNRKFQTSRGERHNERIPVQPAR